MPEDAPSSPADRIAGPAKWTAVALLLGFALFLALWTGLWRTPAPAVVSAADDALDTRLDLNSASAAALEQLPGVGPALAERIVADRGANGPFTSVDALDRVPGIGPKIIERVRDRVRVGE